MLSMKIAAHLNKILSDGVSGNQRQLVDLLSNKGIQATQSSVSRALKKINATRGVDKNGNTVYSLPTGAVRLVKENDFFGSLVNRILDNGHLIVIHTKPGTANTVAKFIDDHGFEDVLGTVAGDDTIMIVPADVNRTSRAVQKIKRYLKEIGMF